MGDPHNKKRYGELADFERIFLGLTELTSLKHFVTVSGGWAWHFLSPKNHKELKHAHDHKDIDIFVEPKNVGTVISLLMDNDFVKVATQYDKKPNNFDFRRYEKTVRGKKITIDFFVRTVPHRMVEGFRIVEPKFLLALYGDIHTSDKCFAVMAATKLIEQGIDVEGKEELMRPWTDKT